MSGLCFLPDLLGRVLTDVEQLRLTSRYNGASRHPQ